MDPIAFAGWSSAFEVQGIEVVFAAGFLAQEAKPLFGGEPFDCSDHFESPRF
jgi:hypothetical protein